MAESSEKFAEQCAFDYSDDKHKGVCKIKPEYVISINIIIIQLFIHSLSSINHLFIHIVYHNLKSQDYYRNI